MATGTGEIIYNSEYRHGVDEKRRVQIPSKWRPAEEGTDFTLILWPRGATPDAFLLVLPPAEMMRLMQKLKDMPFSDAKADALRRRLGRSSDQATLDKAGRLTIPDAMAKTVGITSEAVLVGLFHRFEIWSPKRYDEVRPLDDALSSEAFTLI